MTGFSVGTIIAIPNGRISVEALKIGDEVETLHGGVQKVKWIGRRGYEEKLLAGHQELLPVCVTAGAVEDGVPAHDLFVSPGHGICIDGALVPAARLVNGVTIFQDTAPQPIDYYHFELDEHEVVFAEGCPAESFFAGDFRGQFQNAAPEPLPGTPVLCLPRLEDGFVLHAVQQRLAERAGIPPVEIIEGPLRGFVDQAGPVIVAGWAQCESQPEAPVCLDIFVDGQRILRALANRYREDLRLAGLGSGNHSFWVELPGDISGAVEVRRTIDQAVLPLTEAAMRSST
ncbi:MAG TPA: Hint domain-containing protein [Acidocella sp.]|nr:Hint domain-containing protein [Acidocella sp.]